jgi:chromosome partitioning protein
MKVITVAAPKGGCGKSTACLVLAARAVQDGQRVAMLDLNADQASLTEWWIARGEPENPQLFEMGGKLNADIENLRQQGWDWLIIDTPPLDIDLIEHAVLRSDAVIVPVRSSVFDLAAISPVIEMAKQRRRPFAFLMSAVDSRDAKHRKLNAQAQTALTTMGEVLASHLQYHSAYISALTAGKAGFEIEPKLATEVDGLWAAVKRLASQTPPFTGGRRYDRV